MATSEEQKAAEKWWGKRMWEIADADCDIHTEDLNDAFLAGVEWREKNPKKNEEDVFLRVALSGSRYGMSNPAIDFKKEARNGNK